MTIKGAGYYRVSTDEQKETGRGLERQWGNVREYAAQNGIELVAEFSDDCSGTIDMRQRPEGGRLYRMAQQGAIEVVIADTVDRVTRPKYDEVEFIVLRHELKKMGVNLIVCDTPSTGDAFADNVIGLAKSKGAKEEREKIINRMRDGKRDKARAGLWVGGTPTPYGYRTAGKGKEVRLEVDEREAAIVRRIFGLYTGWVVQRMPLQQIAALLTAEGIHAPGRAGRGGEGLGWYSRTIRALLQRKAYIGHFTYAGNVIELPDLAIIDLATWEAAQDQRAVNVKNSKRNCKHDYLLSSHVRCVCDWSMAGYSTSNGQKEYLYYICGQRVGDRHLRPCRESYLQAGLVDQMVWGWLYKILTDDQAFDEGLEAMAAQRKAEVEPQRQRLATLADLIGQEARKIDNLTASLEDISDATARKSIATSINAHVRNRNAYQAEQARIEAELTQREITAALQADIRKRIEKIRISGVLEKGLFQDKRFLVEALEVQGKIEYRKGRRGLFVTTGIEADGEWLPIEGRTSRPSR